MVAAALSLSCAATLLGPPPPLEAAEASRYIILDNNRDCQADPEATWILGTVQATQKKRRRLRLDVQFDMWGGKEEVDYHLEIAVHPTQSDSCFGGAPTERIPNSSFHSSAVGDGGTVVRIADPRSDFHIYICSDDGTDCSFAGNFVYEGRRISGDSPGRSSASNAPRASGASRTRAKF